MKRSVVLAGLVLAVSTQSALADTITVRANGIEAPEAATLQQIQVATFSDSGGLTVPGDYTASIAWGDGVTSSAQISFGSGLAQVLGSHQYQEEGTYDVTVVVHDTNPTPANGSGSTTATIDDSPLVAGAGVTFFAFAGLGGNNTSTTAGSANNALQAFEAAIGGANNAATPSEQAAGFRTINWDGVSLAGTGGSSTIVASKDVSIPGNQFQTRGIDFDAPLAVTGSDEFSSLNPSTAILFPAFSPQQVFAPFNTNRAEVDVVTPSLGSTTPVGQATRGMGFTFLNVRDAFTTSVEFFDGNQSLGRVFLTPGTAHLAEFVGVLFSKPIITRAEITFGNALVFSYDGSTMASGPAENPPSVNLVAGDDLAMAEPAPLPTTSFSAAGGSSFSGPVASFTDGDPNATSAMFKASIDWGDGAQSAGSVGAVTGGFSVSGTHTYAAGGTYPAMVTVEDPGGARVVMPVTAQVSGAPAPDTTAPDTSITSGPTGPTKDTTPTWGFGANETGSTFGCQIDTAGFAPCGTPFTSPGLADGPHVFSVRASDPTGNLDATPATAAFVVDTKAPALSKLSIKHGKLRFTLSEAATVALTFTKGSGKKAKTLASETIAANAGNSSTAFNGKIGRTTLPRGHLHVAATPTDAAGNRGHKRTASFRR